MRITTIAEAREIVGRTFERDGRRFRIDRVIIHFSDEDSYVKYVSRYADEIDEFNDWLSGATEVTDGCECPIGEAIAKVNAALSAPDPVAEAREIIEGLMTCYDGEKQIQEWYPHAGKARDWLKRNGGAE